MIICGSLGNELCSNDIKGAEQLGRVLLFLDAVAHGHRLSTLIALSQGNRAPIVVLKIIHLGPQNIYI